jgi:uncharacterized membrane protein (DUF4010 family)
LAATVGFALLLIGVSTATRWLDAAMGAEASLAAIAIAGFADVHAASASALSLAASGEGSASQLQLMLLLAISTNTASKLVASLAGGPRYALRVIPSLLLAAALSLLAIFPATRLPNYKPGEIPSNPPLPKPVADKDD